jgi:hypothetical protein
MNKIVRTRYPVEHLPKDLRNEFSMFRTVRLESEGEPEETEEDVKDWLSAIAAHRDALPASSEDPVVRIRRQRDEWDD